MPSALFVTRWCALRRREGSAPWPQVLTDPSASTAASERPAALAAEAETTRPKARGSEGGARAKRCT